MWGNVMDMLIAILFWLHLTALAFGGAAAFGIPAVGSRIPGASAEARPLLFGAVHTLSNVGKAAMAVLIITGPLMVWLRFGGTSGFTAWFWAKMVLVVVLLGVIIYGGINAKRAQGGDMAAAKRAPIISQVGMVTFIGVILCAVFAFN